MTEYTRFFGLRIPQHGGLVRDCLAKWFVFGLILALPACERSASPAAEQPRIATPAQDRVVNVYNWSDYIAPQTLKRFEAETGIRVRYDVFDSNEVLETKLLAGNTGYDVVVPGAAFLERQVKQGIYRKLDRTKLSNWKHLDQRLMQRVSVHDPLNAHAAIYMWGTTGIGFNKQMVEAALGERIEATWKLLLESENASRLAECGIAMVDAPGEVLDSVLIYLGLDPNSESPTDLQRAAEKLRAVRRYVRYIDSSRYIEDLANGEICVALGWSGDVFQARDRAREAGKSFEVGYAIPSEGAVMWFDLLAIPADAPNPEEAHAFLNYLLRPDVAGAISNFVSYANGNAASLEFVDAAITGNPAIYPPSEVLERLHARAAESAEFTRLVTREWTRFRTGR